MSSCLNSPYRPRKIRSLIGLTFGDLVVVEDAGRVPSGTKNTTTLWRCSCKCGAITFAKTQNLKRGDKVSCGCRGLKYRSPRPRPVSHCECGDHAWTDGGKALVVLVSQRNANLLERNSWTARPHFRTFYAIGRINGKPTRLHRAIMPEIDIIDHRNRNGLDNRDENLRPSNSTLNSMNRCKPIANATSQYKGVHKNKGYWVAQIRLGGRNTHLGQFKTEEDAALAYDGAALSAFGEHALLNFPHATKPLSRPLPPRRGLYASETR